MNKKAQVGGIGITIIAAFTILIIMGVIQLVAFIIKTKSIMWLIVIVLCIIYLLRKIYLLKQPIKNELKEKVKA